MPRPNASVAFLSRIARDVRLALVVTYQADRMTRDHPFAATLGRISTGARAPMRLDMPGLERREVAALVEGIEGERPSASIVVLVAERSDGIPLLVEELTAARRELSSASLTGSLAEIVAARLARRTPECRRVLRLLSLAERPITRQNLAEAAAVFEVGAQRPPPRSTTAPRRAEGALDADLAAGVTEALEQGFLVPIGQDGIAFRHELVGRAVAADLLPHQRPRYHAALAVAWAAEPVIAAAHWLAALRPADARACALDAADRADALEAPEDALAALELALELEGAMSVNAPSMDAAAQAATDGSNGAGDGPAPGATEPVAPGIPRGVREPALRPSSASSTTLLDPRAAAIRGRFDPRPLGELQVRAAEAAFASHRPGRAVAFAAAALGSSEDRSDRTEIALLHERLGRYRLASGDVDGALSNLRKAMDLVPREPSVARTTVLASFAQHRMLAAQFREAERAAVEAMAIGDTCGPEAAPGVLHATITLGVVYGWGDDPERGVALLRGARDQAGELGRFDDRFRATANLTTVLDLLGRRQEAVDLAYLAIAEARDLGLAAVYGNTLGGNVADLLFALGRWDESRELSRRALDWSPPGAAFVNAIVNLVTVEIETSGGEEAGRLLGRILVELETGARRPVRRPGLSRHRVARPVERRRPRCRAGHRARLEPRPLDRRLGAHRADGRVGPRGRRRGRRRSAGPSPDRRRGHGARTLRADPRRGREGGRALRRYPTRSARARRRTRCSPRRGRSAGGSTGATTPRRGTASPGRGARSATDTVSHGHAGARPRRCSRPRARAPTGTCGPMPGPCARTLGSRWPRLSRSGWSCRHGHCCASFASSHAGR